MIKTAAMITAFLVAVFVLGYFLTMGGGKPIGTDLSIVGQGKPALVLAYENFSPVGGDALNQLRQVRSDYDSRLDFVVADLGAPQGQRFASRHQLFDGQAVFLRQDGQSIGVSSIPSGQQALRSLLESKLAKVE